jgi:tetratricopeptide (TPR) repeat protein
VSLLLDALKRAEQEKLTRRVDTFPAHEPVERSPARAAAAAALELQPIAGGAGMAAPGASRTDAEAAQAVFRAKSAATPAPRNRGLLWGGAAAAIVVLLAAAGYVWFSLQSLAPRTAMVTRMRPPPLAQPPTASSASRMDALVSPLVPPRSDAAGARPAFSPPEETPREAASRPAAAPPASVAALAREVQAPAAPPLTLARTVDAPRVPTAVATAYGALVRGDLGKARENYVGALAADPANVDAELGLATVEARSGNRGAAADHYGRALDLDPRNATALAGLAALADFSRPEALEARLRSDLARLPGSAALNFTLGNVYASQSRWGEAQAAYFEAYRLQPGNPDIAFNLAVCLDHLDKLKPAADFYARALEAARHQAAEFDPALAERRLAEIGK